MQIFGLSGDRLNKPEVDRLGRNDDEMAESLDSAAKGTAPLLTFVAGSL